MLVSAQDLVPVVLSADARAELHKRVREWVAIDVAGTVCGVAFDDAEHAASFRRRYVALYVTAPPVLRAFAMTDPLEGPVFGEFGAADTPAFRWPGPQLGPDGFLFFTDAVALTLFFRAIPETVAIHAGAVGTDAGVAAIIGETNTGKTTTAVACGRFGMSLYSDERCVFTPAGVVPFPRAVNVRAGGRARLAADRIDDVFARRLALRGPQAWKDQSFADLFGSWTPPPAAPLRTALLITGTAEEASIERVIHTEAVRAALRWAACPESGLDRFARVMRCFSGVACYRLTLGSPAATAKLIAATLASDARAARHTA